MKISEYIAALETIKAEHGDLEVWTEMHEYKPVPNVRPNVDYLERNDTRFAWDGATDGRKVCRV